MSILQRIREAFYCRRIRDHVTAELRANGFRLVSEDLKALGIELSEPTNATSSIQSGYSDEEIAAMWQKAAEHTTDEVILGATAKAGIAVGALGDGGILAALGDFFRKIIDWLSDPANQAKILAVVKFLMLLLGLFGI